MTEGQFIELAADEFVWLDLKAFQDRNQVRVSCFIFRIFYT